eukprot:CAMPEP_0181262982 /NCGR_PEP_ID=MMETSP1097-20121128/2335_1 /TAXON_ID=35684 /ORGANISM="Pseudopedinella elastica, Strain CCMP716" /LENGTH=142 /DNA_ID=CAMNT_0023361735 /DNA_START=198 /DNA_END=623 /DNA_ORIENTATION=+
MDPRERTRGGGRREPCRVVVDALVVLVHVLRIVAFDGANRVLVAVLLEGELDEEGRQEAEQSRVERPAQSPPSSYDSGSIAVLMQAIMEPPANPSEALAMMFTVAGNSHTFGAFSSPLWQWPGKMSAVKKATAPVPMKSADH